MWKRCQKGWSGCAAGAFLALLLPAATATAADLVESSPIQILVGGPLGGYTGFNQDKDVGEPEAGLGNSMSVAGEGNLLSLSIGSTPEDSDIGSIRVEVDPDPGAVDQTSKIIYFTPRVANFQLGISYTQEDCGFSSSNSTVADCYKYRTPERDGAQETGDRLAVGVNYQRRVSEVDLGVSTSIVPGVIEEEGLSPLSPELKSWNVGLAAGYRGFTFSTSYYLDRAVDAKNGNELTGVGLGGGEQATYDVGVKYATGPWALGVQYSRSEMAQEEIGAEQQVSAYEIGGSYVLGPALSLGAAVQFWRWDELSVDRPINEDEDSALVFLIGSVLKF